MIRSLKLICHDCHKSFQPTEEIFYRDDFSAKDIKDVELLCADCVNKWKKYWDIASAEFLEENYCMYVTITLKNGEHFEKLDCTPMDGIVVTGKEIPLEGQQKLYEIYQEWDIKRKKDTLKDCFFKDEFMRTTFTCETYGGEKFENIAFRFNMEGALETEKEVPIYIKEQIITAWKMYEAQNK